MPDVLATRPNESSSRITRDIGSTTVTYRKIGKYHRDDLKSTFASTSGARLPSRFHRRSVVQSQRRKCPTRAGAQAGPA